MQILPAVSCLVKLLGKPAVQLSSLPPAFSSVRFTSPSSPLEVVFLEVAHASLLYAAHVSELSLEVVFLEVAHASLSWLTPGVVVLGLTHSRCLWNKAKQA